jgi:NAD(P)H-flavin reductase/ferredoxin
VFDRLFRRGPSEFKVTVKSPESTTEATLSANAKESVLVAALNQGLAFPYNCRVGGCGECKCRLIEGKVKELTDKSYLLSAEELKQNVILACQSLPRSDLVIEVALRPGQASHPIVERSGTIDLLQPLTHDILRVGVTLNEPLTYTAGQYADITVPATAPRSAGPSRSYSFATACDPAQPSAQVEFFIRKVPGGGFTTWLFTQARTGAALQLRGPYGDFRLQPGLPAMVCIAGGSGLAPVKALLEQAIRDKENHRHVVLVFGARTQQDLYALDEIDQIRRAWSGRFSFVPVLSAEPAGSDWTGRRGLIHEQLNDIVGTRLAEHQAYLCGPPAMIDACLNVLTEGGVAPAQVFFDKFLDSGHASQVAIADNGQQAATTPG